MPSGRQAEKAVFLTRHFGTITISNEMNQQPYRRGGMWSTGTGTAKHGRSVSRLVSISAIRPEYRNGRPGRIFDHDVEYASASSCDVNLSSHVTP